MTHLQPRWRKMLRDLATNKTRTALVVLALAVGVFTVSFLINAESLLRTAFAREFAAVNPSSATLLVPDGFDQAWVKAIRRMPSIQEAEGRGALTVRLKTGANQWINLNISAIKDFDDIRIDKIQPHSGAWPPAKGEILLERSSLRMAAMPAVSVGDRLTIQTLNGGERTLTLAGLAYDFNRTPSPGTGVAYGFVTLDTLERLDAPAAMNDLRIIVAGCALPARPMAGAHWALGCNALSAQDKLNKDAVLRVANQVQEKIEKSGRSVGAIQAPEPGQHPLGTVLDSLGIILGALSALTLVGGAFLVFNTIAALLAQQVRQIGIMKAIGARSGQIAALYLGMVLIFGLLVLAITTPLAIVGGVQFAKFFGDFFNLDLQAVRIPALAFAAEALIAFGVPLLAALYPIWSSVRMTVQEALADYGLAKTETTSLVDRFLTYLPRPRLPRPVLLALRNTFRRRARLVLTLLPLALSGAILLTVVNVRAALMRELDAIFGYKNYDVDMSFERPYRLAELESIARQTPGVTHVEGYRATTNAYRMRTDADQTDTITERTCSRRCASIFVLGISPTLSAPVGCGLQAAGDPSRPCTKRTGAQPTTSTFRLPLMAGRWLTAQDQAAVVINDAFLRDQPDIGLGDRVLFKINERKVTLQVVGIVSAKMTPAGIYLNDAYFARLLGDRGRVNRLWVVTDRRTELETMKQALEAQFAQADLRVVASTTVRDERGFIDFHFSIMVIPLGMTALLLAFVGGLGLMGTMSTNVLERRREIGVMRAIGASDGGVQQIFMVEGLFIGLLSWFISLAAALPLTYLLNDLVGNRFLKAPLLYTVSLAGMLTWLVIVVVTVALSCYLPARSASQTYVRNLLAYE